MVLILDDNSEIGGLGWSEFRYLISGRRLFSSRVVSIWIFLQKFNVFLYMCSTCFESPYQYYSNSPPPLLKTKVRPSVQDVCH